MVSKARRLQLPAFLAVREQERGLSREQEKLESASRILVAKMGTALIEAGQGEASSPASPSRQIAGCPEPGLNAGVFSEYGLTTERIYEFIYFQALGTWRHL